MRFIKRARGCIACQGLLTMAIVWLLCSYCVAVYCFRTFLFHNYTNCQLGRVNLSPKRNCRRDVSSQPHSRTLGSAVAGETASRAASSQFWHG
ncbi:hypothetical protein HD806DRAFT_510725 [Xylariaceae sp. AK1471]|nr:hypothetical protein HD806DRAFT_510725 [Xylariaceae sp. AK1471]